MSTEIPVAGGSQSLSGGNERGNERETLAAPLRLGDAVATFPCESDRGIAHSSFPAGLETDGSQRSQPDPFIQSNLLLSLQIRLPLQLVDTISGGHTSNTEDAFDPTQEYSTSEMVLFWQPPSVFSQWTGATFLEDGVSYINAEQYFASEKARLFGDTDALQRIMRISDPRLNNAVVKSVVSTKIFWRTSEKILFSWQLMSKFSQKPSFAPSPSGDQRQIAR